MIKSVLDGKSERLGKGQVVCIRAPEAPQLAQPGVDRDERSFAKLATDSDPRAGQNSTRTGTRQKALLTNVASLDGYDVQKRTELIR